jgi:hypothetical protein
MAGYWKDPYAYDVYLRNSSFLADLNNERLIKNPIYKKRITTLKTMMLLHSTVDDVRAALSCGLRRVSRPVLSLGSLTLGPRSYR